MNEYAQPYKPALISIRGFVFKNIINKDTDSHMVNEKIDKLYAVMQRNENEYKSWPYRKEVLSVASLLLNNFNEWVRTNSVEGTLYGRRFDFLNDTVTFIKTGKRSLAVNSWKEILEESILPEKRMANQYNLNPLYFEPGVRTADIISMWCSQEKGFTDMLCTLDILFGVSRGTDLPEFSVLGKISAKPL